MHGNAGSGGEALDAWSQMNWRLAALGKGFATAVTNTGHDGVCEPGFSFAANRQKLVDFGFRAVHETVVAAKGAVAQPGVLPGSEIVGTPTLGPVKQMAGWRLWLYNLDDKPPIQFQFGQSVMRFMSGGAADPARDPATFAFDRDLPSYDWARSVTDADDPDLRAFQKGGGKLLMYFGWADAVTSPTMAIDYYEQAMAVTGPGTPDFFRLFMIPGMNHCRGGVATDTFDPLSAMVSWVEAGKAPERIKAERGLEGAMSRSRPLCPYPQIARYKGEGSINNADNFDCGSP
jgi:feruloyl esterase